jgi:hypothetical protein
MRKKKKRERKKGRERKREGRRAGREGGREGGGFKNLIVLPSAVQTCTHPPKCTNGHTLTTRAHLCGQHPQQSSNVTSRLDAHCPLPLLGTTVLALQARVSSPVSVFVWQSGFLSSRHSHT